MRDVDHRDAELVVDALDLELELVSQLLVEGSRGSSIEEQLEDEGAREGDALLLPARELAR